MRKTFNNLPNKTRRSKSVGKHQHNIHTLRHAHIAIINRSVARCIDEIDKRHTYQPTFIWCLFRLKWASNLKWNFGMREYENLGYFNAMQQRLASVRIFTVYLYLNVWMQCFTCLYVRCTQHQSPLLLLFYFVENVTVQRNLRLIQYMQQFSSNTVLMVQLLQLSYAFAIRIPASVRHMYMCNVHSSFHNADSWAQSVCCLNFTAHISLFSDSS